MLVTCGRLVAPLNLPWDASFYAGIAALLDPEAPAADLVAWLSVDVFKFFGIELDNMRPTGYFYAFSASSLLQDAIRAPPFS